MNKEEEKALWSKMMWYKTGFWVLALVYAVFIVLIVSTNVGDAPETHLVPTEDTRSEFVDTTFTMQTRSADAIVMQFDIEAKLVDRRDIFSIKNRIHEESLQHNVMWFYESVKYSNINDSIWLTNATITGMAFEQYFMDLVNKKDSLPVNTQLPIRTL